jgi:hypothetical protein
MADAAAAAAADPVVPVREPWMFDWDKRLTKHDMVRLADLLGAPDMSRFDDEEIMRKTSHHDLADIVTTRLRLLHDFKTQGEQDSNTADDEHDQAVLPDDVAWTDKLDHHLQKVEANMTEIAEQLLKLKDQTTKLMKDKDLLTQNRQFYMWIDHWIKDGRLMELEPKTGEAVPVLIVMVRMRGACRRMIQSAKSDAAMEQWYDISFLQFLEEKLDVVFYEQLAANDLQEHVLFNLAAQTSSRFSDSSASSSRPSASEACSLSM